MDSVIATSLATASVFVCLSANWGASGLIYSKIGVYDVIV